MKGEALEFEVEGREHLDETTQETVRRLQGLSDTYAGSAVGTLPDPAQTDRKIEKAFDDLNAMAATHQQAIRTLSQRYDELGKAAMDALLKGTAKGDEQSRRLREKQKAAGNEIAVRADLLSEIEAVAGALTDEKNSILGNREKVVEAAAAHETFSAQLQVAQSEMSTMEDAGATDSDQYRAATAEAERLAQAIARTKAQLELLGRSGAMLKGIVSGMSGVSGAFSAAQGAVRLFGVESAGLEKIMAKVNSIMEISNGLQKVSEALNNQSAFSVKVLGGLKQWWAGVVAKTAVAEKVSTAAAAANTVATGAQATAATAGTAANIGLAGAFRLVGTAIKSIPVFGWIIAGVSALGGLISVFTKNSRESKKAAEEFRSSVVNIASGPISAVEQLSFGWEQLGDNMDAKQKFIEDNAEKFKELGVAINSVQDAENLLVTNKDAYIDAQIAKARATVYLQQTAENVKRAMELEAEIAGMSDGRKKTKKANELQKVQQNIRQGYTNAAAAETESAQKMAESGVKPNTTSPVSAPTTKQSYPSGSVGAYEEEIRKVEQRLKGITNPEAYAAAMKEIEELQKKLNDLTGKSASEAQAKLLDEFDKQLQAQLNSVRTIEEKLQIIEKHRREAEATDQGQDEKMAILDTAEAEVIQKGEKDIDALLNQYSSYLQEKINFDLEYGENRRLLQERLAKATTEKERQIVLAALDGLEKDRKKYDSRSGNEDYDGLLEQYRSYSDRRAAIAAEYDEKIASASEQKNEELVEKLSEAKNKALSSVALEELQDSGPWKELFGNLDDLTVKQIEELTARIESSRAELGVELDPEDMKVITDKLEQAQAAIRAQNPFKALQNSLKEYRKEATDANLTQVFKDIGGSFKLLGDSFDAVVGGLKGMGLAGDEVTGQILGNISKMAGSASQLAEGLASKDPVAIIQGGMGLITSAMDLFDSGAARKNQRLLEEIEFYNKLAGVYDTLIDKQQKITASLSGKEAVEAYEEGLEMIAARQTAAQQSLKNWFGSGASWKSHSEGYKYDKEFGGDLSQDQMMQMSGEEWSKWIRENAELWTRMPQQVKDYAEAVIEADATTEELAATMKEASLGFSLDEATSSIMSLVGQSDVAFEDIGASFQKHMRQAILRTIQTKIMEDGIKKWYDNFSNDMNSDGGLSPEEAAARQKEFADLIAKGNAEYKAAMEATGLALDEAAEAPTSSLSGAIKGASQESIDLLAGQTNAVRINQVESIELMRNQLLHLASIDARIGVSNRHLQNIDNKMSSGNYDPLRAQGIN